MQRRAEAHSGDAVPLQLARRRTDEIVVVDLWLIVRKRWPWLLAGLLAGLIGALSYVMLTTPTYESRAVVQIGQLPVTGPIVDIGALTARLVNEYGVDPRDGTQPRMPYLKEAAAERGSNSTLKLTSVGHSPREARGFLTQIVAGLIERHERVYESAVGPLEKRIEAIGSEVGLLRAQAAELDGFIASLKETQPAQAALVAIERARLHAALNELERDRVELQQQTVQPYSIPSRVLAPASFAIEPNAPKKAVAVVIGLAVGLMLGLLAVFSTEFLSNPQAVGARAQQMK